MSKEKIQLLSHHVRSLKYLYPSTKGMEERAVMVYDVYRKLRLPNGELQYPNVTEGEMLQTEIKVAHAVLENNYQEIPDRKRDGTKFFDIICYSCPNYKKEPEECRAEKICNEMSIMEYIRYSFYRKFTSMPVLLKFYLQNLKEDLS
ncbi:MAG TPA: hypothetical protein VFD45_00615 [Patescibacteria group bacterium]|nr:hypothetical protein [Patescibacteria group bacterium]